MFWQPARKCTQSYYDYATQCPAKHDVYSVLSTEGGLNVNMGHIVYTVRNVETKPALFRATTPSKEFLPMVVPASLLLIFIFIVALILVTFKTSNYLVVVRALAFIITFDTS